MTPTNINQYEISPHVLALVEEFIPDYIRSQYPGLVDFVVAYLAFLERTHGSSYYQNTLQYQRDIEKQEEEFLSQIEREIGLYVPREYESSPRLFYNRIAEIWRSKGSKESVELFFRLFLKDPVQIRYPWDKVLKPSDGRWLIDNKLRVSMISGSGFDFIGTRIFQIERFASAVIEKVERKLFTEGAIFELTLLIEETAGEFIDGNTIRSEDGTLEGEIYRSVSHVVPVTPGDGYRTGERIRLKNYDGYTFVAYVSAVDESGGIIDTEISNFGAGNTPAHIRESDNENEYYFEDFLVYDKATDNLVLGDDLEYEINTREGSEAEFELRYSPVVTTSGRYAGVRGQLSESIVLQDSDFYQRYSYEVVSSNSINTWFDALKKTVHPTGTKVFSNINVDSFLSLGAASEFYSEFFDPPNYDIGDNVTVTSTILGFTQNYAVNSDVYFRDDYTGDTVINESYFSASTPIPSEEISQ